MPNDFAELIEHSKTSVTKLVFPNTTNHHDTLFGGTALEWMDEVAFIAATRLCRQKVVTVSMERVDFKKPIPAGTIVELIAQVSKIGTTSLLVKVELYKENMYSQHRELAVTAEITFVAIGEDKRPITLSVHSN